LWIETMIRKGVGRKDALIMEAEGISRAEMARIKAYREPGAGEYFPVSRAEVEAARDAALGCGVTYGTLMRWHLLRRNYEADPSQLWGGPLKKVRRNPPLRMSMGLVFLMTRRRMALGLFAEEFDAGLIAQTAVHRDLRAEIDALFQDLRRPLAPRRPRRKPEWEGKAG
jgi:hypothetical protein